MQHSGKSKNWFESGGSAYAAFRPDYPMALSAYLADLAPSHDFAVDAGCGTGQFATQLAQHFARVVGVDSSADQITNAARMPGVEYFCAAAHSMPVQSSSVSLITAAQAAHWFDLPAFYSEVRRVAASHAVIALISYGVMGFENDALNARFQYFYKHEIGPYWPPERKLVDDGYASIPFPFSALPVPDMRINRAWRLAEFYGYLSTWSATRQAIAAERTDILSGFSREIAGLWGDPHTVQQVSWPINIRLGKVTDS